MAQDYFIVTGDGGIPYQLPRDAQDATGTMSQTRGASIHREPGVSAAFEVGDKKWRPREISLAFMIVSATKEDAAVLSDAIFENAQAATSLVRDVGTGEVILEEDGTQLLLEDGSVMTESIGCAIAINVLSRITARQWHGDATKFTVVVRWQSKFGQATLSVAELSEEYAAAGKTFW